MLIGKDAQIGDLTTTLEIARFANLLLAGLPAGNEFGARATALPAPPLRKVTIPLLYKVRRPRLNTTEQFLS